MILAMAMKTNLAIHLYDKTELILLDFLLKN